MPTPRLLDGRLKLRHLILVDVLTERGSVVSAAAALHVTQPVVTRGLHDLEAILGVQLYERGPRGVTPNEFGLAFTDHARAVLAQLNQAARHIEELADATRGEVVVGTHLAGSNLLLPRAIAHVKRDHPMLRVSVREGLPDALLVDLTAGRVDLVVGRLGGAVPESLSREALYEEHIRIVTGAHHPLAGRRGLALDDLADYPWILPGRSTRLRDELEAYFARHGFVARPDQVEATSFLTVRQLLIETEMVAALPGLIGAEDPRLTVLPLSLDLVGHSVGITRATDRQLSPAAGALIASLRAVATGIGE
ncbi:LysR substrate-binding domain-containing protein [Nocardioides sp. R1-1]|uniref:LysR substrate-binding domain-containing protein n=1 Tax=Nocardioides sp. R1-1 TaxID=3383502 RepID=UPI0038CF3602